VNQDPDKAKLPATSYRGTFRRHRTLFCVPVILGALVAAFVLSSATKSYTSTASLWIDTAPPLPTSAGAVNAQIPSPPASAEQGILSELLTTDSFATSVAQHSLLGKLLGSPAAIQAQAPQLLEAGQVIPDVTGQQILKISYTGASPALADSVLGAIVSQLSDYHDRLTAAHDQGDLAYDREQVKIAQSALATARTNVSAYLAGHPAANQLDPNYMSLVAAETTADTQLGQANTALSQATGTPNGSGWTIQVVDAPGPAVAKVLRKKTIAEGILGGAIAGMLLSFLVVVALTPAKKEVWEDELPIGHPFVPDATRVPSPSTVPGANGLGHASRNRRLVLRHRPAEIEER
jgi:uncharacterized protein involved in exopolysaccharide biosynthesis